MIRFARPLVLVAIACLMARPAAAQTGDAVSGSYILSPNDQIQIEVFQEDDLRTSAKISKEGTITFPLLGNVKLAGLTMSQAAARLTDLLKRDFLVNPRVSMTVVNFSKKRFTVLGQVNSPGIKEMPDQEGLDLLEAIGMAGGYTRIANPGKITIKRREGGSESVIQVDGKAMAKGNGKGFQIKPGDTITVAESIF
jgi:protein involved in polysaccharide export with SLBB domain